MCIEEEPVKKNLFSSSLQSREALLTVLGLEVIQTPPRGTYAAKGIVGEIFGT